MRKTVPEWLIEPPKQILIRMPNWIGDAVMAIPVLEDLKKQWPAASLTIMCQSKVSSLFLHNPHIDEIFSFEMPSGWIHRFHHNTLIEKIRSGKFDLGILLTHSFSSAWWFFRGRVKFRIGYSGNLRRPLLTHPISKPTDLETLHQILYYKNLLVPLGIPISETAPKIDLSSSEKESAIDLLKRCNINPQKDQIIGINPGAAYGSAKCWLPDRFTTLAKQLIQDPSKRLIFFGDKKCASLVASICESLPEPSVLNLSGKTTLRELIAITSYCKAFITNDSGPMHIATALGIPVIALFGSTNEERTGPTYGKSLILNKRVSCSPCYKRTCPIDFRCMTTISVDEVIAAVQTILKDKQ